MLSMLSRDKAEHSMVSVVRAAFLYSQMAIDLLMNELPSEWNQDGMALNMGSLISMRWNRNTSDGFIWHPYQMMVAMSQWYHFKLLLFSFLLFCSLFLLLSRRVFLSFNALLWWISHVAVTAVALLVGEASAHDFSILWSCLFLSVQLVITWTHWSILWFGSFSGGFPRSRGLGPSAPKKKTHVLIFIRQGDNSLTAIDHLGQLKLQVHNFFSFPAAQLWGGNLGSWGGLLTLRQENPFQVLEVIRHCAVSPVKMRIVIVDQGITSFAWSLATNSLIVIRSSAWLNLLLFEVNILRSFLIHVSCKKEFVLWSHRGMLYRDSPVSYLMSSVMVTVTPSSFAVWWNLSVEYWLVALLRCSDSEFVE